MHLCKRHSSRDIYFCVQGHALMHIPQIVTGMSFAPARRLAIAQQAWALYIDSLSVHFCQFLPKIALVGQRSTQLVQSPQRESSIGLAVSSGASVSTDARRTAGPWLDVINNADLPIHPRPARVATVLCGSDVVSVFMADPSIRMVGSIALARYPCCSRSLTALAQR